MSDGGIQRLRPTAFPVDEEAYEYVCFLRSEGAPKSKIPRFRKAVNFAGALLGFDFFAGGSLRDWLRSLCPSWQVALVGSV